MEDFLRKHVTTKFRLNGFLINCEAVGYVTAILSSMPETERKDYLEKLMKAILKTPLASSLLTKNILVAAAKEGELRDHIDILTIINAFEVPRLKYDSSKNNFIPCSKISKLFGNAEDKAAMFRNRYSLLLQRTLHHKLFANPSVGIDQKSKSDTYVLSRLEYLIGSSTKLDDLIVLGMITQITEGKYHLEDTSGIVEADLSNATFHTGIYTECCFVLAEGFYEDKVFFIKVIGLPPAETARISRSYFGQTNFFGHLTARAAMERLETIERDNKDIFVLLSDIQLDSFDVVNKLKVLFDGYSSCPPFLFIFMGNFLAPQVGIARPKTLRNHFAVLADTICQFPSIKENSKFLFVPGPQDPGYINILPRPPFAKCIVKPLEDKLKYVTFSSNPCRIKYCTKEIVIFRADLLNNMRKKSLFFPSTGRMAQHYISTLISQAHLCPFPKHIYPTYWGFEHALDIYPLPDLVILGDEADPFTVTTMECNFVNPGSFVKTNFSFKTYRPFDGAVEDCHVSND